MADGGSRQWASNQYSWERAALSLSMWVGPISFQLQFPASSLALPYTLLFYCMLSTHFLHRIPPLYQSNRDCGARMRVVYHVLSPLSSPQSFTCPSLSLSLSICGWRLQTCSALYEVKLATRGMRNTRDTLNIWAPFFGLWAEFLSSLSHRSLAEFLEDLEQQQSFELQHQIQHLTSQRLQKQAYMHCFFT